MKVDSLLNIAKVSEITGLSRSNIYLKMGANDFPEAYNLGGRRVAWKTSEIQEWIDSRQINKRAENDVQDRSKN